MKLIVVMALALCSQVFAGTIQDCFKIKNGLDRKYCMDKYVETVKNTYAKTEKTWAKGVDKKEKATLTDTIQSDIQSKKDHLMILQEELTLAQKHLDKLKATKVAKAEKKEEKKKKDKGFRIKL